MANDYLGLMQSINQPQQQKQAWDRENQNNTMAAIFGFIKQQQTNAKIKAMIKEAQDKGYQVEYKIDPATGQTTPVIKSGSGMDEEAWKALVAGGKYEPKPGAKKGSISWVKKPTEKEEKLNKIKEVAKNREQLIKRGKGRMNIPLLQQGDSYSMDLKDPDSVRTGLTMYLGDESWKEDEEIQKILSDMKAKTTAPKAKTTAPKAKTVVASRFKAGDIQTKDGKKYIRDDMGKWYSLDTE